MQTEGGAGEDQKIQKVRTRHISFAHREFTFTVNDGELDCGLNGALYFVEMQRDGGLSEFPTNGAGAAYGTGYCDAQCPHDIKWINGEANMEDWEQSETDINSGTGRYGAGGCHQASKIFS